MIKKINQSEILQCYGAKWCECYKGQKQLTQMNVSFLKDCCDTCCGTYFFGRRHLMMGLDADYFILDGAQHNCNKIIREIGADEGEIIDYLKDTRGFCE